MSKKSKDACATCFYWLADFNPQGLCRRYPPAALVMGWQHNPITPSPNQGNAHAIVNAAFPPMSATGWCGEFKKRK